MIVSFAVWLVLVGGVLCACRREDQPPPQVAPGDPQPTAAVAPGEAATPVAAPTVAPSPAEPPVRAFVPPKPADADLQQLSMSVEMRIRSVHQAASQSPGDADKISELAALYYVHGFAAEATACLEHALSVRPGEATWLYYLALAREKAGRSADAVAAYEQLLSMEEGMAYSPAYVRLADLLAEQDPSRAGQLYGRALEIDPTNPRACCGLGRLAAAQGNHEEAVRHFQRATAFDPDYGDAHRGAADSLAALGLGQEASWHLRRARGWTAIPGLADPALAALCRAGLDAQLMCADALTLAGRGNLSGAEEMISRARQIGGAGTLPDETMGLLRLAGGRYDEAARLFDRVLKAEPESLSAKSNLAAALAEMGQAHAAEQLFREILAERPEAFATLGRFDRLMNKLGRPEETTQLVREALAAEPANALLHFQFGQLLVSRGRHADAIEPLRQAVALQPALFTAYDLLAGCLGRQGDLAGARAALEQALETNPKFPDAHAALAALAWQEHDLQAAERVLRRGLEHLPDAPMLANSLAWLLATTPDAAQRNGTEAVQWARKACDATRDANHAYLDTLAAAYAAAGQFAEAVETARRAIALATQAGAAASAGEYGRRLALYEGHQAYHESP